MSKRKRGEAELKQNRLKNQKGSIMITVIVILAILVVLGVALLDSSTSGFRISKHEEAADMAYNAAESAIEKCFSYIKFFCDEPNNTKGIAFDNEEDFANKVINEKIKPLLMSYTSQKYSTDADKIVYKIKLSSKDTDKAQVWIQLKYLGWEEIPGDKDKINVTIGATAISDLLDTFGDNTVNKEIFSSRKFVMYIPRGFELNAAIYSIGDMMVENINAQVSGDVVAFGTSPEYTKQIQQYYYGGIYAKNRGHLSVYGNAYSRGLIRTGEYNNIPDNSSIYIYKDAIANGLHIFGRGDKIVVGRNAYTFDDLELNGEDSVIAINGSFVGLSNSPSATNHDESSAIVNSAVIHHAGSDLSERSRIVINGDAIVNGGTFRVEPASGSVDVRIPQIEDASIISRDSNSAPMYREFMDGIETGNITVPDGSTEANYYHQWLYNNRGTALGFANLIQCWKPANFTSDAGIKAWTDRIDNARRIGFNDPLFYDPAANTDRVSGFCHYEIGANDRIYFMDKGINEISKLQFINNGFILDNIDGKPGADEWADFWDGLPVTPEEWSAQATNSALIAGKLSELKNFLMPKTQIFSSREYTYSALGDAPINNTLNQAPGGSDSGNLFMHINDLLNAKYPGGDTEPTDRFVLNLSSADEDTPVDLKNELDYRIAAYGLSADNDYFLIYNSNPAVTIHVNTKVNGIIYSLGQIIVEKDADVTGSIIAAGKGFTRDASKDYKLDDKSMVDENDDPAFPNYLPVVLKDGENLEQLDNGSYAGIYFKGASNSETARVSFPGKDDLLGKFNDQGMDLYSIFDF
ncbi:pilus assembly PilX family protein [Ruminiclostridium cellobioparum]|uniref:pilus assembly PilX family protein n=1 Tax=Ruminiclostridium cellobioparum TaxID=29355 RepID=UPI0028AEC2B8|nr:pilus assembly PilX N-terminal domain-containing protein [Ruminiclostridium cellobioparum]